MNRKNKNNQVLRVVTAGIFAFAINWAPLVAADKELPAKNEQKEQNEQKNQPEQGESPSIFDLSFWSCPIEGTSTYRIYLNKILCVLDSPTQLAKITGEDE